jgi:threonine dehydratase
MTRVAATVVVLIALSSVVAAAQRQRPISVYVGPQVREGFVDADAGTLDSIDDLKWEIDRQKQFRLVDEAAAADLILFVLGRGRVEVGDATAVQIGAVTAFSQDSKATLRTLLKVGTYEKSFVGESGTWGRAASQVIKDLKAWTAQNRDRLPK